MSNRELLERCLTVLNTPYYALETSDLNSIITDIKAELSKPSQSDVIGSCNEKVNINILNENKELKAKLAEVHREYARANNILLEAERNTNVELTNTIDVLEAKLAEAEKDAKRYRHLRNVSNQDLIDAPTVIYGEDMNILLEDELDDYVDNAIEEMRKIRISNNTKEQG